MDPTKHHEIALISLETYNSIPNIDESNNIVRYSFRDETHDITIPTGAYELKQINDYIQRELVQEDLFEFIANDSTLKCIVRITNPDIKVHFDHTSSLREILGFDSVIVQGLGDHEGSSIVNILKVNSILVHCDRIEGSYLNKTQAPVIYSFFPNVSPGYKIVENPSHPIYLPVSHNHIENIRIWLTDQDRNPIDLRGETVTVRLNLRSYDKWKITIDASR